eukprot:m.122055 g.122055  ORF g.122055 m.122055 type:complete len:616 (+) comp13406_c0_seq1:246-2093(+)
MSVTLRIRTPSGQSRVKVSAGQPVVELFELVASQCNITDTFKLARNPNGADEIKFNRQKQESVESVGLQHGDLLHLIVDKDPTSEASAAAARQELDKVDVILDAEEGLVQRKPDPTMCRGCDEKNKCINCLPLQPFDPSVLQGADPPIKFLSFHAYLRKLRTGVDKGRLINLEEPVCEPAKTCTNCAAWPKALCSKCQPSALRLTRQEYRHVDYLSFQDQEAVQTFVSAWIKSGKQRYGLLYGYYDRYDGPNEVPLGIKACVEAIYEPPQMGDSEGFDLEDDPNAGLVDAIARALGLKVVGAIYTDLQHAPELPPPNNVHYTRFMSDDNTVFSAMEVLNAATMQDKYPNAVSRKYALSGRFGSKFVTCVVSGSSVNSIEPQAYMATDNAVAMVRASMLAPSATAVNEVCVAASDETRFVPEVLYTEKNEYDRLVVKKAEPSLPSDMLHVQLPAGAPRDESAQLLKRAPRAFPTENREAVTQEFQGIPALAAHFAQPGPLISKFSDFHLLLFLGTTSVVPFRDEILQVAELVAAGDSDAFDAWALSSNAYQTMKLLIEDGGSVAQPANPYAQAAPMEDEHGGGGSASEGGVWQCRACTFINERGGSSCEICQGPRT